MFKTLLVLICTLTFSFADTLQISTPLDSFNKFVYKTQFDKKVKISDNIKTVVISYEKDTGRLVNKYLNEKYPPYLGKMNAVFIADIHEMPSLITKFFAMPKMKKYKHTIYIYEEDDFSEFAKPKDEKVTVVKFENQKVKKIYYISTPQELKKAFED
jgi:hypothetical protein